MLCEIMAVPEKLWSTFYLIIALRILIEVVVIMITDY